MNNIAEKNKVEKLQGFQFLPDKLKLKPLGDFLYHEGPLLTHCINANNEDYLMGWCDKSDDFHRWLLYKTNFLLLHDFFEGKKTIHDLILSNPDGYVYFVDIGSDMAWKNITLVTTENIPEAYLPGNKSTFEENVFEPYANQVKSYIELHFSRKQKLYEPISEPELAFAEPATPYHPTKK